MADEVFSGGVSVTGVEPGTTTIAIKSTTNPNISKKVPVTVKSRNLLAYGPASGNGLTVTVAQDGFEISWMISFGTGILALAILVAGSLLAGRLISAAAPNRCH